MKTCIKCNGTIAMENFRKDNVSIDICPSCNSIWFDSNELFQTSEKLDENSLMSNSSLIGLSALKCPSCSADLNVYKFSKDKVNLEYEKCPECHGFWFDRGEFQNIRDAYSFIPDTRKIISRAETVIPDSLEDEIYSNYRNAEGENPRSVATYLTSMFLGIPFEYRNRTVTFPKLLVTIILINFAMFFSVFFSSELYTALFHIFSTSLKKVLHGNIYTMVTYSFIHLSFMHVAINMYFMWIFGDNVFDIFMIKGRTSGRIKFLLYFSLCAAAGAFGHFLNATSDPKFIEVPLAGASGVTSALVASYYKLFPKAKFFMVFLFIPFYARIKFFVFFYIATNIMYAFSYGVNSQVSWQAHLAGFAAGYFLIDRFIPEEATHLQD